MPPDGSSRLVAFRRASTSGVAAVAIASAAASISPSLRRWYRGRGLSAVKEDADSNG